MDRSYSHNSGQNENRGIKEKEKEGNFLGITPYDNGS